MRAAVLIAISLALGACSPAGNGKSDADASAAVYAIELSAPSQFAVPQGAPIVISAIDGGVRLAGHVNVPDREAPLMTQGASLRLTQQFEQAAASHRIRVTIRARSMDGATSFHSAYSTNDVGNSQWRELPLTSAYTEVSYEWNVGAINRGADDFIGINPPETGSVDIASIRVDRVQPETPRE